MRALRLIPRASTRATLEIIELPNGTEATIAQAIREHIGDWFTACFRVQGDLPHTTIAGYCDDSFLLKGVPHWSCVLDTSLRDDAPYPIGGVVVICGEFADTTTRALSAAECAHFTFDGACGALAVLPDGTIVDIPVLSFHRKPNHN